MNLELISPDNDSVILSHTPTLGLLGSLRAAGVDLVALLPKEAIAATWDPSLVSLLEGYLNHLRATSSQSTQSHTEHIVVREVDMTPEQKKLLPLYAYTSKSVNDFTTYEYDRVISDPLPPIDTHVEEEKAELTSLIAFFQRGETEHDLLHNDLYAVVPVPAEQPVGEAVTPGVPGEASHEETTPLS